MFETDGEGGIGREQRRYCLVRTEDNTCGHRQLRWKGILQLNFDSSLFSNMITGLLRQPCWAWSQGRGTDPKPNEGEKETRRGRRMGPKELGITILWTCFCKTMNGSCQGNVCGKEPTELQVTVMLELWHDLGLTGQDLVEAS
jgi:hypothetical protein